MNTKSFDEVLAKFQAIQFDESFDMIVAIANGGIIPASILNQKLNIDFQILKINLRDKNHQAIHAKPVLLSAVDFDVQGKRILLVDDRNKTGATIEYAKELMKDAALVKTFAVNGKADYALYDETCFKFPWIM